MLIIYLLSIAILFAVDRITKIWVATTFVLGESRAVIPNVFHLTYIENQGAAFGILSGYKQVLLWVTIVAIIAIAYYFWTRRHGAWLERISLILVLAGALGNAADRIMYGSVTDFFDLQIINFAIFNVADCFVSVGVGLYLIYMIWGNNARD